MRLTKGKLRKMPTFLIEKRMFGRSKKKKSMSLSMTSDMYEALDQVSVYAGRSRHDIVLSIIDQFLQQEVESGSIPTPIPPKK